MNNSEVIPMPTISISQEVYDRLKKKSRSWEDTPNKVIREKYIRGKLTRGRQSWETIPTRGGP